MITIKEIAELAGTSRGTVDRVINNRGNVKPEIKEKVLNIIEKYNYKPNKAGLALAAKKKKLTIGVILFSKHNPFFIDVINGMMTKLKEAEDYGISMIRKEISFDLEEQKKAILELKEKNISCLIISPLDSFEIRDLIGELYNENIPVITVNTDIKNSKRLAYVGSDYYNAGSIAAGLMKLFTKDKIKLGIILGSKKVLCHTERLAGFRDTIKKNYKNLEIIAVLENNDDDNKSYEITKNFINNHKEIKALFFAGAGVAGGTSAIKDANLKDIYVITFDTLSSTINMLEKGIITATIDQQPFMQGYKSIEVAIDYLIHHISPKKELNYLKSNIIIKENIGEIKGYKLQP